MIFIGLVLLQVETMGAVAEQGQVSRTEIISRRVVHGAGEPVRAGDRVTVHLRLTAGERVLRDTERSGLSFTFVVGSEAIPGFLNVAVTGLKAGGGREFFVPWELAGGESGVPPVLPGKTDVEAWVKVVRVVQAGVNSRL